MPISIVIRKDKEIIAKHEPLYEVGSTVYLVTDPEQYKRLVLKYYIDYGSFLYEVACGSDEPTLHYEFELSDKVSVI